MSHQWDASNGIDTLHGPDFRGFFADLFWATIGTKFHAAAWGQASQMNVVNGRTGA